MRLKLEHFQHWHVSPNTGEKREFIVSSKTPQIYPAKVEGIYNLIRKLDAITQ